MAYATTHHFQFEFIPPRAAHFGGQWESSVKMAKGLLLKAIGNAILREDELQTVLVEVEAVLNSRPLVTGSNNPNDGQVIAAVHFLIGSTLGTLPSASAQRIQEGTLTHLKRWQLVSAVKQQFWSVWSRDYLASPQQRAKWTKEERNLRIGDVVIVQKDNLPPQVWVVGVVMEVKEPIKKSVWPLSKPNQAFTNA